MILTMIRAGVVGEPLYAEAGYPTTSAPSSSTPCPTASPGA
jgi:hypothetical protein